MKDVRVWFDISDWEEIGEESKSEEEEEEEEKRKGIGGGGFEKRSSPAAPATTALTILKRGKGLFGLWIEKGDLRYEDLKSDVMDDVASPKMYMREELREQ